MAERKYRNLVFNIIEPCAQPYGRRCRLSQVLHGSGNGCVFRLGAGCKQRVQTVTGMGRRAPGRLGH
jgi:hypothetical protein